MVEHRVHSIEFKRQQVAEHAAGETLHALARRYGVRRGSATLQADLAPVADIIEPRASPPPLVR